MPEPYRWTCITEQATFAGRDGAGALVLNDRMWLLGGWNPDDKVNFPLICNSEVWSSIDGKDWTLELPEAPWEPRHCAGYVVHRDKMWIVGGDTNQFHYQDDVWNSADGIHWRLVTDHVPWHTRAVHYTVAFQDAIWVMGGQRIPKHVPEVPEAFYNDVWRSEDGAHWERVLEHAPWSERGQIGGSAVHNGRIWLLGGGTYETPNRPNRVFHNEVWSTADGVEWELVLEHAPWHPREYPEGAVFDNKLWVMEGWNPQNRNDVWYSADGVEWHELPGTPWPPRHAASVFVYQDALWMVAGNNMAPDVWKLTKV
ncbi:MAG: Kelch repeat-containing protein [Armatimonadota bacterium]